MARPHVTISQGSLEGIEFTTDTGFKYNAFLGIPYAKPPVGELRFKEPQPADGWEGVRDASVQGSVCSHVDIFFKKNFLGDEDCLYLNVYVPNGATVDSNLPVMFWIHGGGFSAGSGNKEIYGPDHLISKNVIFVSINYRLGPLGFLCLHTPEAAGNAGLKDQTLALKWVNENIKQFGGDVNNITIFGESAGAGSVSYLQVSPLAKGLFSKAINQSGTCINCWSMQSDPLGVAFQYGEILGLKTDDKKELYEYLMKVPSEMLIKAALTQTLNVDSQIAFSPVIEESFPETNPFITEHPRDIIKEGRVNIVPTISGFNSNEGVLLAMKLEGLDISTLTLDRVIPDFKEFVPKTLRPSLKAEETKIVAQKVKDFYFENEENLLERFFTIMSDFVFVNDIQTSVKLLTPQLPAMYNYRFSYNGSLNVMKLIWKVPYRGAAHADELGYMFKISLEEVVSEGNDVDNSIINLMSELWTNFAKYGNPTPKLSDNVKVLWEPVTSEKWNCLDIDEETTMIQEPFAERMKFWETLGV